MKTIAEIRLENLEALIKEFGTQERVAGLADTSPIYLSQVRNRSADSKTGKPRQIGDPIARKLETGCGKELGWMDNTHALQGSRQQRINHVLKAMESMNEYQFDQTVKIVDTLAEPADQNGTTG